LIKSVAGLTPGLYRYVASQHALLELDISTTIHEKISTACFSQKMVESDAITFIWVAVTERMAWRYGERAYRYLHLDAGHVCQNLYLAAEPIDCGVCAVAAFEDNDLNTSLRLDGKSMFAIYLATVGKKLHNDSAEE
jgi:SagB-type dehydrogenase family enzyme